MSLQPPSDRGSRIGHEPQLHDSIGSSAGGAASISSHSDMAKPMHEQTSEDCQADENVSTGGTRLSTGVVFLTLLTLPKAQRVNRAWPIQRTSPHDPHTTQLAPLTSLHHKPTEPRPAPRLRMKIYREHKPTNRQLPSLTIGRGILATTVTFSVCQRQKNDRPNVVQRVTDDLYGYERQKNVNLTMLFFENTAK